MSKHFEYTDDPADPCPYCVQWEWWDDDSPDPDEDAIPYMPSGPVTRVRRQPCVRCLEAIAMYQIEHRGDIA